MTLHLIQMGYMGIGHIREGTSFIYLFIEMFILHVDLKMRYRWDIFIGLIFIFSFRAPGAYIGVTLQKQAESRRRAFSSVVLTLWNTLSLEVIENKKSISTLLDEDGCLGSLKGMFT